MEANLTDQISDGLFGLTELSNTCIITQPNELLSVCLLWQEDRHVVTLEITTVKLDQ